jgi:hypothetical protein
MKTRRKKPKKRKERDKEREEKRSEGEREFKICTALQLGMHHIYNQN